MATTVPLAALLDSLLQKSYHELTVLAELLPRKSDVDRKIGIVGFARQTRLQLVRLLALVKWAGSSDSVQKCSEMSELLSQQSWLYEDTANQLVHLARHQLLLACMPNFSLAPALDVLCTGTYPRLPTCIRDNIVPPSPLTGSEAESALSLLTVAVRRRLHSEQIPSQMSVRSIEKGVVVFEVPFEFKLSLSVVGDDLQLPWRLVNLEVQVGAGLSGGPRLCHSQQTRYLTQLSQSHLVTAESPLLHVFSILHTFCLSLVLDCLHTQATQMSTTLCGGHVRVEEYQVGHLLRLGYWYPTSHPPPLPISSVGIGGSGQTQLPKIQIMVDPTSTSHPITTTHTPPLPLGHPARVELGLLSLEVLIGECVTARSSSKLQTIRDGLKNTAWENRVVMCKEPQCLKVNVPVRGGVSSQVILGVDIRTGSVGVTIEPYPEGDWVEREISETEKALAQLASSLPLHLFRLQCQLLFDKLTTCAKELGLVASTSIPLPSPLPLPSPHLLFVRLLPLAYLVVCGVDVSGQVEARYYLLEVVETNGGGERVDDTRIPPVPRIFYSPVTLTEVDNVQLVRDSLNSITVRTSPAVLKRKLQEDSHGLPNTKRVCVMGSHVAFSSLPPLCSSRLLLAQIKTSLKMSGIRGYQVLWTEQGCPCISICEFPLPLGQSLDVHHHLSSLLLSCLIYPSSSGHKLMMVFSPLTPDSQAPDIVLHHQLSLGTSLGPALLALWESQLTLLSMALELQQYLEDTQWPLSSSCQLSHFGFDSLTVTYGNHSLSLHGGMNGLHLSFSPDSPHMFLTTPLQQRLLATLSLPVLLKGVVGTEDTLSLLHKFTETLSGSTLVPLTAAQIQLQYHNLSLSMNILNGGSMEFTNLQFGHQRLPMTMPGIPSPLGYLKSFIYGFMGVEGGVSELEEAATPLSRPLTGRLQPTPMPISSPSRPLPSSPIPSIPSLPTPPSFPHSLPSLSSWSYVTNHEQLRSLLLATPSTTPTPPLTIFMSSLSQLCHFWMTAALDRAQNPPNTGQLQYMSTDRRVYHYRTETLNVHLSIENPQNPTLQLQLTPAREGCWSPQELQLMTDFWKKEVACPPFSLPAVNSYVKLLQLPLLTLKSCVQLIGYHLTPPPNLVWNLTLCMVIPQAGSEDLPIQLKPGTSGIIYKGKLLLMIQLTHTQDGRKTLIPLMHDFRVNNTFAARHAHQTPALSNIDTVLKKASHECTRPNHQESSIFPAVKALLSYSPNL